MPLYEYECTKCHHRFEKIEHVNAPATKKCPQCRAKAERTLTAPAIQFKGSGWYVTDYAGKNTDGSAKEGKSDGKPTADSSSEKKESTPAKEKPSKS